MQHKQIVKSSLWTIGGNGLQQLLQFLIFILLARYLDAESFGYVALAAVAIEVAGPIVRWGIPDVLLQRHFNSPSLIFHAFFLSLALGIILTCLIIVGVVLYTSHNGPTIVASLSLFLVPTIILQAIETVPDAIIRKNMAFKWLAVRSNAAALLGGGAALVCIALDAGIYALIVQRLVSAAAISTTVCFAATRYCKFYKPRPLHKRLFKGILSKGSYMLSSALAPIVGPRIMDALIGGFLGVVALGQFKIALRISELVTQLFVAPISNVAHAVFPKLVNDRPALEKVYRQMILLCSLAVFPMYGGLALTANEWVPLLLGAKWTDAVPIIQAIGWIGLATVVNYFQPPVLVAFKRNRLIFYQGLARIAITTTLTAIGVQFGMTMVLTLFLVNAYGYMIYNWYILQQVMGRSIRNSCMDIAPAMVATLGMCGVTPILADYLPLWPSPIVLAAKITLGCLIYGGILLLGFRRVAIGALRGAKATFAPSTAVSTDVR